MHRVHTGSMISKLTCRYEREEERIADKKPVQEQFLPLADVPEIQKVHPQRFKAYKKYEKSVGKMNHLSLKSCFLGKIESSSVGIRKLGTC